MLLQTSPVNSDPDLLLHCNANGLRGVWVCWLLLVSSAAGLSSHKRQFDQRGQDAAAGQI